MGIRAVGLAAAVVAIAGISFAAPSALARGEISTSGDSAVAVYEGRTPCSPTANAFTGFPAQSCEKIKWQVTLFVDAQTKRPSKFLYEGTRTSRRGTWTVHRGTPFDRDAQVYRLSPGPSGKALSLLDIDDKVLVLLDDSLRVVVGDASWSYVLNRTDKKIASARF